MFYGHVTLEVCTIFELTVQGHGSVHDFETGHSRTSGTGRSRAWKCVFFEGAATEGGFFEATIEFCIFCWSDFNLTLMFSGNADGFGGLGRIFEVGMV